MAELVASAIKGYLEGLPATSAVCSELGTTLTYGTNLFVDEMPNKSDCIVITGYGGAPPNRDGYRQDSYVQIAVRSTSRSTAAKTSQALINTLTYNDNIASRTLAMAQTSVPLSISARDAGKSVTYVSNYRVVHVKY